MRVFTCANFIFTGFNINMLSNLRIKQTLNNIPLAVKSAEFPLEKVNLRHLEGIQSGIPLFDNGRNVVSMPNIGFISKRLETLDLYRGCDVGCTHCLKDATHLPKNKRSILFEDLIRFTEGFKTLSERLGFNALSGNKYLNIIDDSNPTDFPIRGLTEQHSISEGIKLIYENLKLPVLFVTSGWNEKSVAAQNSAEQLARDFKLNPQSLKSLEVSVNPFSAIMENSRNALKIGDKEKAELYRNLYTDRISNTILTFFDLFKGTKPLGKLIYRHANNYKGNELVGEQETKKIYEEIYSKLKDALGDKISEAPTLAPQKVTVFDKSHLIEPSGRARRYFPYEYNMKLQSELIAETEKWNKMSAEEKKAFFFFFSIKCIDINGNVYSTFPSTKTHSENIPIELTVPADITLNYINKQKTTPVFSDIELD